MFDGFGVRVMDKKGRIQWNMPKPTSVVIHKQLVGVGKRRKMEKVEVPVYRGLDAKLFRELKSELRRRNRLEAERNAKHPKKSAKVEVPDDLIEELTE